LGNRFLYKRCCDIIINCNDRKSEFEISGTFPSDFFLKNVNTGASIAEFGGAIISCFQRYNGINMLSNSGKYIDKDVVSIAMGGTAKIISKYTNAVNNKTYPTFAYSSL